MFDQIGHVGFGPEFRDYYLDRVKYGGLIELYRQFLVVVVSATSDYVDSLYVWYRFVGENLQHGRDCLRSNSSRNTPIFQVTNSKIVKDVDEVIEFESKIAKIMVAGEDCNNQNHQGNLNSNRRLRKSWWLERIAIIKIIKVYAQLLSNDSKIVKDVDEVIEFESKIAKIMVAEEDRNDHTRMYNLRRLADMEKLTPMVGKLLLMSCYP
ncbi:hypothetical protein COOONC_02908 [Cooperia oncophora]